MATTRFAQALTGLRDGSIGWGGFLDRSAQDFRRLAQHLVSRWDVPPAVGVEDVEQELRIGVHRHVGRWDPERGPSLKGFVVFNAVADAKRWLHQQRGSLRRSDSSTSRYPLSATALAREGDAEAPTIEGRQHAQQEACTQAREVLEAAMRHDAAAVAYVLGGGDEDEAAELLLSDLRAVIALQIDRPAQARAHVRRAAAVLREELNHGAK